MIIGYVAQKFPLLTLTFVYREIFALRETGIQIRTFSTWKPTLDELSDEAKALVNDTFYVFPLNPFRFLWSHLWYLVSRPHRYLGTLWYCLTREHNTLRNRIRTFFHFCQAVYMARSVEQQGVQHLHVHFALNSTTIAMVVSRLVGITFSFTAHANDIFVNPILLPEKIKAARFIIGISEYNKRFLYNIVPNQTTLNKIHIVRYGVDVDHFCPPRHRPENDPPVILAVGRLVEKKGFPYLIKACKILVTQNYRFRCVIVGGGPQHSLLEQMIEENNLSDHVTLAGVVFQEHLKRYFDQADFFVLPCVIASDQDRDGIPNTLIEAMAMELPVISTTVSGIPELIEDGNTGLLVAPEDEFALAKTAAKLLVDKDLRLTLGTAGRAKVKSEFEIEQNVNILFKIFNSYLESETAEAVYKQEQESITGLEYYK